MKVCEWLRILTSLEKIEVRQPNSIIHLPVVNFGISLCIKECVSSDNNTKHFTQTRTIITECAE